MIRVILLEQSTKYDTKCKNCEEVLEKGDECIFVKDKNDDFLDMAFCSLDCLVFYIENPPSTKPINGMF